MFVTKKKTSQVYDLIAEGFADEWTAGKIEADLLSKGYHQLEIYEAMKQYQEEEKYTWRITSSEKQSWITALNFVLFAFSLLFVIYFFTGKAWYLLFGLPFAFLYLGVLKKGEILATGVTDVVVLFIAALIESGLVFLYLICLILFLVYIIGCRDKSDWLKVLIAFLNSAAYASVVYALSFLLLAEIANSVFALHVGFFTLSITCLFFFFYILFRMLRWVQGTFPYESMFWFKHFSKKPSLVALQLALLLVVGIVAASLPFQPEVRDTNGLLVTINNNNAELQQSFYNFIADNPPERGLLQSIGYAGVNSIYMYGKLKTPLGQLEGTDAVLYCDIKSKKCEEKATRRSVRKQIAEDLNVPFEGIEKTHNLMEVFTWDGRRLAVVSERLWGEELLASFVFTPAEKNLPVAEEVEQEMNEVFRRVLLRDTSRPSLVNAVWYWLTGKAFLLFEEQTMLDSMASDLLTSYRLKSHVLKKEYTLINDYIRTNEPFYDGTASLNEHRNQIQKTINSLYLNFSSQRASAEKIKNILLKESEVSLDNNLTSGNLTLYEKAQQKLLRDVWLALYTNLLRQSIENIANFYSTYGNQRIEKAIVPRTGESMVSSIVRLKVLEFDLRKETKRAECWKLSSSERDSCIKQVADRAYMEVFPP